MVINIRFKNLRLAFRSSLVIKPFRSLVIKQLMTSLVIKQLMIKPFIIMGIMERKLNKFQINLPF